MSIHIKVANISYWLAPHEKLASIYIHPIKPIIENIKTATELSCISLKSFIYHFLFIIILIHKIMKSGQKIWANSSALFIKKQFKKYIEANQSMTLYYVFLCKNQKRYFLLLKKQ